MLQTTINHEDEQRIEWIKNSKSQKLLIKIFSLIDHYKLTLDEICAYLVEKNDISETEGEIKLLIVNQIKEKNIEIVNENEKYFLKPTASHLESWKSIDRSESINWFRQNTILDNFYVKLRGTYNNLIKYLQNNKINNYNLVYDQEENPCEVSLFGKKGINFASNDYLGLAKHPRVIATCIQALKKYGNGTGGSRVMVGTTPLHKELESIIAQHKNTEDAVVFSSGYLANLAMLTLLNKETVVLFDSLDHASIIDGLKMSDALPLRFKHNDIVDLEGKIKKVATAENKLVFVEGIYSMDGDIAKLPLMINLCKKYNAKLAVDEAHSTGVLGENGGGIFEHFQLGTQDLEIKIGTLSKAIGAQGGYIAGKKLVMEAIRYSSRQLLFSTSLPASIMAGAIEAFNIIKENNQIIARLHKNAKKTREALKALGFDIGKTQSQIIPLIVKNEVKAHTLQVLLRNDGIYTMAITYPGVAKNQAKLRLSISAAHSDDQIDKLIDSIYQHGKELGII